MMSIQGIPLQVAQTEAWRKFAKLSMKTGKVLFCRSLAGEASYVKHASELWGRTWNMWSITVKVLLWFLND